MRTLARTVTRTGVLQVDSVNVLQRAHYMPLYSRMGPYDVDLLRRASEVRPRRMVEYFAHVQAFMPVELWPIMRHRMAHYRDGRSKWWGTVFSDELIESLLAEIADRGASTARDLDDGLPREKKNWGWNWSTTRQALDYMYMVGDVAIAGRNSQFEIRYDLPERVIPSEYLEAPTPSEHDAVKELVRRAARSHGVGTLKDLADYYRLRSVPGQNETGAAPIVEELVEEGELRPGDDRGPQPPGVPPPRRTRPAPHPRAGAPQPVRPRRVGAGPHRGAVRLLLPDRDLHPGREAHPRLLRAARSCSATGSSAGSTSRPTGRPGCCWSRRRTPSRARPTRPPRSSRPSWSGSPAGSASTPSSSSRGVTWRRLCHAWSRSGDTTPSDRIGPVRPAR